MIKKLSSVKAIQRNITRQNPLQIQDGTYLQVRNGRRNSRYIKLPLLYNRCAMTLITYLNAQR